MKFLKEEVRERYGFAKSNWDMHHQLKTDYFKTMDDTLFLLVSGAFTISVSFLSITVGHTWICLLDVAWGILLFCAWCRYKYYFCMGNLSLRNQILINHWITEGPVNNDKMCIKENMDTSCDPEVKEWDRKSIWWRNTLEIMWIIGMSLMFIFAMKNLI